MAIARSRRSAAISIVVGTGLLLSGYFWLGRPDTKSGGIDAPTFRLESIEGKQVQSKDFEDEVLIVHFWAAWCAPCIPEIPEVLSAATRLPTDTMKRPIRWILISVDETWEKARKVLDPSKLPPGVVALLDPDSKIAEAFGTFQYPETYVISRKGKIAAKWIGPQQWSGDWGMEALKAVETLSRTQSVPQPESLPGGHPNTR